jgi:cysteine-S-conjugate beta-lyase
MIHGFTKPSDKILIQEPVYHYFKKSILELSRVAVINQLEFINGSFEINFSLLESQLIDHVKIFLLCSPHNPIGRIWKQEEILRIAKLCSKYNVLLISDEIHSDLCMPNQFFYSICEIDPNIISSWVLLNSPTKAFNFAGLRGGYVIVPNQHLKEKISTYIACFGVDKINALFPIATVSAYNNGSLWNKKITAYIYTNYLDLINSLKGYDHWLQVSRLQATYLVWVNYSNMQISEQQLINALSKDVIVEPGSIFGENGEYYFRVNIACHNNLLKIALKRIIAVCIEIMQ